MTGVLPFHLKPADEQVCSIAGQIPEIVNNCDGLYEGDLVQYQGDVVIYGKHIHNGYHNVGHNGHVLWACFQACKFHTTGHGEFFEPAQVKRKIRNLLIAAMWHDFDHIGRLCPDKINIQLALIGLEKYILPEDRPYLEDISDLLRATEFPYPDPTPTSELPLSKQIIRDADLGQSLNHTWFQQTICGLAREWGMTPIQVLERQEGFYRNLNFSTAWARQENPPERIERKIQEVKAWIDIFRRHEPR